MKADAVRRRSTGPRTESGKKRSSRNALRHGLSLPVVSSPRAPPNSRIFWRMGVLIQSEIERAKRIAEAQVDLVRIRQTRAALYVEHKLRPDDPVSQVAELGICLARDHVISAQKLAALLAELTRLDRYERPRSPDESSQFELSIFERTAPQLKSATPQAAGARQIFEPPPAEAFAGRAGGRNRRHDPLSRARWRSRGCTSRGREAIQKP